MSLSQEERQAVVEYRIEKARTSLTEAKQITELELWNTVANRMYYALYYAATALLINNGYTAHTHAGVITLVGQHFVKTGLLSQEGNKVLKRMYALRQEGDYEDFFEVTKEEIDAFMPKVEALLENIISLIN